MVQMLVIAKGVSCMTGDARPFSAASYWVGCHCSWMGCSWQAVGWGVTVVGWGVADKL